MKRRDNSEILNNLAKYKKIRREMLELDELSSEYNSLDKQSRELLNKALDGSNSLSISDTFGQIAL